MIKVNVADAKANLSDLLRRVEAGEVVVLCRRNVPVAEIRPAQIAQERTRRVVGAGRRLFGDWTVPESFDEPVPDWMIEGFEGS